MTAGTFLVALTLVVLVLLLWNLRWVLLVLFGAVVVAVALDVLIVQVQKRTRVQRPQALAAVLGMLLLAGGLLGQLLVPELISQFQQLGRDLPQLFSKVSELLSSEPQLAPLNEAVGEGLNLKGLQPLLGFAGGAANSLIQLFLMSLLAILLALDPRAHRHMVVAVTPRPARKQMEQLLEQDLDADLKQLRDELQSATTNKEKGFARASELLSPAACAAATWPWPWAPRRPTSTASSARMSPTTITRTRRTPSVPTAARRATRAITSGRRLSTTAATTSRASYSSTRTARSRRGRRRRRTRSRTSRATRRPTAPPSG